MELPKNVSISMKPSDLAKLATFKQKLVQDEAANKVAAADVAKVAEPDEAKAVTDADSEELTAIARGLRRAGKGVIQLLDDFGDTTPEGSTEFAMLRRLVRAGGAAVAPETLVRLWRVILAAYYRDDRVLRALGHEARPPFPKGYAVEQGDWSLVDAVRSRAPFWRDDRKASR